MRAALTLALCAALLAPAGDVQARVRHGYHAPHQRHTVARGRVLPRRAYVAPPRVHLASLGPATGAHGPAPDYWLGFVAGRIEPPYPAITVELDGVGRDFAYAGHFTLRDPYSGDLLGRWPFVSGGGGRGSAPFGRYELGAFRGSDDDPHGIGPRWMVREVGREDGEVWDNRLHSLRTAIELHMGHTGRTLGCFAIMARWPQFMDAINYLTERAGRVTFSVGP